MTAVEVKRRVTEGTRRSGETVWVVTGHTTVAGALGDSDLPPTNEKFPGIPTLRAKEHIADQIDRAKPGQGYEVTIRYEPSAGFGGDIGGIDDPNDPGFKQIDVDFTPTFVDVWRAGEGSDFTQLPSAVQASGTLISKNDIGGNPMDSAGEPTSIVRVLATVVVGYTISGFPPYADLLDMAGARNNSTFLGASTGAILFKSCTSRRVGTNTYTLTYTFAYDDWYHLVQVPDRGPDGIVALDANNFADNVYWAQPFRKYDDLNGLPGLPL